MILLGKRIKELRNKYKFTQTELTLQVGVTKSTIAAYENDSRQPSYDVLIKLADVFKVSIDSILLNRSEDMLTVNDLTIEQMKIIENLILYFKKINCNDTIFSKNTLEFGEHSNNK